VTSAFDQALGKLTRDIVGWVLVAGEADAKRDR
jgi:ABC-type uncharacterized transport system auxiliary subunit